MKKTKFFYILYFLLFVILFCSIAEVSLRLKGEKPWRPTLVDAVAEPDNKWVIKDDELGHVHAPGKHKLTINKSFSFTATVLENNLRIAHPLDTYRALNDKDEIWIFGCSFTFGGGCNDNQTYPWLLQEKIPKYEVVNFGFGGGGTLVSLIQFREAVKKRKIPKIVIIAYASFHDERNSFSRKRRKSVVPNNHLGPIFIPYARLDRNGRLHYYRPKAVYEEFPLMRHSVFITWLEKKYNAIEDYFIHSHEVSKAIIKEFDNLCKTKSIKLIIAGIIGDTATKDMLKYCQKEGIANVDISVDLKRKGYSNAPYDAHPTVLANKEYAEKLHFFIKNKNLVEME